jgi:hypothetical protein
MSMISKLIFFFILASGHKILEIKNNVKQSSFACALGTTMVCIFLYVNPFITFNLIIGYVIKITKRIK